MQGKGLLGMHIKTFFSGCWGLAALKIFIGGGLAAYKLFIG